MLNVHKRDMKSAVVTQESFSEDACEIAFVFIAGGSAAHLANMRAQQEACFSLLPGRIKCVWLISDKTVATATLAGSVLYLPIADEYENLLSKTIMGIGWVLSNWKPKYIIRSNTSNYFNLFALEAITEKLAQTHYLYGGASGTAEVQLAGGPTKVTYVSGAGIYLDQLTARKLLEIDIERYSSIVEDIAIGDYFENLGQRITEIHRNDVTDWRPLEFTFQSRIKAWHSDEITLNRFKEITQLVKSTRLQTFFCYLIFEFKEVVRAFLARSPMNSLRLLGQIPKATLNYLRLSSLTKSKYSAAVPQSK